MTDGETHQGSNRHIITIGIGLAIGVGLLLLFFVLNTSGKAPTSSISPPNSDKESFSEMPADFSVIYAYGIHAKNILNTVNNTHTRDMVVDPSVLINLTLSDVELSTIWNSTQNKFFELKNLTDYCPHSSSSDGCTEIIPEKEYRLTITANGQNHTVMLRQNYELNQAQDTELHKFKNITTTIDDILSQKEELKQLPKPRGGYE